MVKVEYCPVATPRQAELAHASPVWSPAKKEQELLQGITRAFRIGTHAPSRRFIT
jgi:hypothetical protein